MENHLLDIPVLFKFNWSETLIRCLLVGFHSSYLLEKVGTGQKLNVLDSLIY